MTRVGTSGWSYDHWTPVLYPPGLPAGRRLAVYAAEFDAVELNGSFYRWPTAARFEAWRASLPGGFEMAVKAPRGLTHARRLRDPEQWLSRVEAGLDALGARSGPLLVQLPPTMERDDDRLRAFLEATPSRLRPVLEFRHPTWHVEDVFGILEAHGASYCVMSGAQLPCILRATSRLVYVRLHGPDHDALYAGSYSDADLRWWAHRIREWEAAGHVVHAYFNNDGHGYAVHDARRLRELVG